MKQKKNVPALMACLSLHRIIYALPIRATSIHKQCPIFLTISQKLIMFFWVNFWLWTFTYVNPIIFQGVSLLFITDFRIANRSQTLQPKTQNDFQTSLKHMPRDFHKFRIRTTKITNISFLQKKTRSFAIWAEAKHNRSFEWPTTAFWHDWERTSYRIWRSIRLKKIHNALLNCSEIKINETQYIIKKDDKEMRNSYSILEDKAMENITRSFPSFFQ